MFSRNRITEETALFASVAKWLFLSTVIGLVVGAGVSIFLKIIQYFIDRQGLLPFHYYFFLPIALLISVYLVMKFAPDAEGHGTEKVIQAIHERSGKIDVLVIPVKILATIITIAAGGSVGKEGPSAQIGAGVASVVATFLKFSNEDRKAIVICGISAGFASVFGTPIAGAVFGVEVLVVGSILYSVLLPSFIAGFASFLVSETIGTPYISFHFDFFPKYGLNEVLFIKVVIAGILFGLISDLTITFVHGVGKFIKEELPVNFIQKSIIGGLFLVGLALMFGDQYLGLGMAQIGNSINNATGGGTHWYDFLLKIVFTGLSLGFGGSGGVITPLFFIGSTSGHAIGTLLGGNVQFFAALGLVSIVAGAANTPIAATIMALELFGIQTAHYAAISSIIAYLITGHRSIYPSQILAFKKSQYLEVPTGHDIEHTKVVGTQSVTLNKLRERWGSKKKLKKDEDNTPKE